MQDLLVAVCKRTIQSWPLARLNGKDGNPSYTEIVQYRCNKNSSLCRFCFLFFVAVLYICQAALSKR